MALFYENEIIRRQAALEAEQGRKRAKAEEPLNPEESSKARYEYERARALLKAFNEKFEALRGHEHDLAKAKSEDEKSAIESRIYGEEIALRRFTHSDLESSSFKSDVEKLKQAADDLCRTSPNSTETILAIAEYMEADVLGMYMPFSEASYELKGDQIEFYWPGENYPELIKTFDLSELRQASEKSQAATFEQESDHSSLADTYYPGDNWKDNREEAIDYLRGKPNGTDAYADSSEYTIAGNMILELRHHGEDTTAYFWTTDDPAVEIEDPRQVAFQSILDGKQAMADIDALVWKGQDVSINFDGLVESTSEHTSADEAAAALLKWTQASTTLSTLDDASKGFIHTPIGTEMGIFYVNPDDRRILILENVEGTTDHFYLQEVVAAIHAKTHEQTQPVEVAKSIEAGKPAFDLSNMMAAAALPNSQQSEMTAPTDQAAQPSVPSFMKSRSPDFSTPPTKAPEKAAATATKLTPESRIIRLDERGDKWTLASEEAKKQGPEVAIERKAFTLSGKEIVSSFEMTKEGKVIVTDFDGSKTEMSFAQARKHEIETLAQMNRNALIVLNEMAADPKVTLRQGDATYSVENGFFVQRLDNGQFKKEPLARTQERWTTRVREIEAMIPEQDRNRRFAAMADRAATAATFARVEPKGTTVEQGMRP